MKVYQIEQFKCTFCSQWFDPYNQSRLPMLLSCGHSICYECLSNNRPQSTIKIICPEDLNVNIYKSISQIQVNQHVKSLLVKILGEQSKVKESQDYLGVIKEYLRKFEEMKENVLGEVGNLLQFVNRLYAQEIQRIESVCQKVKIEINRPINLVNDWKENVKNYLKQIKSTQRQKGSCEMWSIEHYLEEARRVELEVKNYLHLDKNSLMARMLHDRRSCLKNNFSLFDLSQSTNLMSSQSADNWRDIVQISAADLPIIQSVSLKGNSIRNSLTQLIYSPSVNESGTYTQPPKGKNNHYQQSKPQFLTREHELAAIQLRNKAGSLKIQQKQNWKPVIQSKLPDIQSRGSLPSRNCLNEIQEINQQMLISCQAPDGREKEGGRKRERQASDITLKIMSALKSSNKPIYFNKTKDANLQDQSPGVQVVRKNRYVSEQYLHEYSLKSKVAKIEQALRKTVLKDNFAQLMGHTLEDLDFGCYLQVIPLPATVEVLKFVKVNMQDEDLNLLLNYVLKHPRISTLVLSNNHLTDQSLDMLVQFFKVKSQLKNIYLSKNHISAMKVKGSISQLKGLGVNIYI